MVIHVRNLVIVVTVARLVCCDEGSSVLPRFHVVIILCDPRGVLLWSVIHKVWQSIGQWLNYGVHGGTSPTEACTVYPAPRPLPPAPRP